MSQLATPIAPVELSQTTKLDQATADALAAVGLPLTTQEQVDAVKDDLAAFIVGVA